SGRRIPAVQVALVDWVIVLQSCMFRRGVIERAGPYRSDLMPSEDIELFYRALLQTRTLVHVPEPVLLYRVHPENQISERDLSGRICDRGNLWLLLDRHLSHRSD